MRETGCRLHVCSPFPLHPHAVYILDKAGVPSVQILDTGADVITRGAAPRVHILDTVVVAVP